MKARSWVAPYRFWRAASVAAAMLLISTPQQGRADSVAPAALPAVIKADDGNKYLKRIPPPVAPLRVERVIDQRTGPAEALGTMYPGNKKKETPIVFGEPLAGFLDRAFSNAFANQAPAGTPIRLQIAIEQFELEETSNLVGEDRIQCRARLGVTALTDSGPVDLGWIEHKGTEPTSGLRLSGHQALTYRAITALGQSLARDDLGARVAQSDRVAAARHTVTADYRGPEPTYQRSPWDLMVGGQGFTNQNMSAVYQNGMAVITGSTSWSTGKRGERMSAVGIFPRSGTPTVVNRSWAIESRSLRMYTVSGSFQWLFGFSDRIRAHRAYPYVGLGYTMVFGEEQLKVKARRDDPLLPETMDHSLSALRGAIGAQALSGMELRVADKLACVIEGGWTQSTNGFKIDLGSSRKTGSPTRIYDIVDRSKFNFTGWHFGLGLRMYD